MSEDYKYQLSVKVGPYGDLVNFRADTLDELEGQAEGVSERSGILAALAQKTRSEWSVYTEFPETEKVSGEESAPTKGSSGAKICAHGLAMVYKSSPGGNGKKPWKAYMCAAPKEGMNGIPQCAPEWIRD